MKKKVLYRHKIGRVSIKYTEDVKELSEKPGMEYILDEVLLGQTRLKIKLEPYQSWHIVTNGKKGIIRIRNADGKQVFKKELWLMGKKTPLRKIKLLFIDGFLMLPNETSNQE